MVYRLPPVRRCLVTAAEWWVTSGDGWAVAPLAVAGLALMAAVVAVVLLRWEVVRPSFRPAARCLMVFGP